MWVLLRLAKHGFRYRLILLVAWICLVGANVLALTMPWIVGISVDSALNKDSIDHVILLALYLLVIGVVRGGFSYGQTYLSEALSARVAYDLRNLLLENLERLSFAYHDRQKTGDLMSLVTYDVESTRMFISFGLVRSLQLAVLILGLIPLLIFQHWQLGLISLAAVPITLYTSGKASRILRWLWLSIQRQMGWLTTILQEDLTGIRTVKTFGAERFQEQIFAEKARGIAEDSFKAGKLWSTNTTFLSGMFLVATGVVVWYGGTQVMGETLTAGELTRFLLYLGMMVMPIRMIGWAVNTFSRAMSSGERIFNVLDLDSELTEKTDPILLDNVSGSVSFEDVSFQYQNGKKVLEDINFSVSPGQKVAVVGPPGSGKSTVMNLIPRFYDVDGGTVKIDGIDVKELNISSLRRQVGFVFQDTFIFHSSIRENISYGSENASSKDIEEVAKLAHLHDFIVSLPDGYSTIVGERGVTLSGGQRQRLSIARTLLIAPAIVILDDSTASVDVVTEKQIREALKRVMEGRTTFIIAHRVSSVRTADLILVMDNGRIAHSGTHEELLDKSPFYRTVFELQIKPSEETLLDLGPISNDNDSMVGEYP